MIKERAPHTYQWVCRMQAGERGKEDADAAVFTLSIQPLKPLLSEIVDVFFPLLIAMESAYETACTQDQRVFNETAFDKGQSLFTVTLRGQQYTSVVKTFQVKVFRSLKREWLCLSASERTQVKEVFPAGPLPTFML